MSNSQSIWKSTRNMLLVVNFTSEEELRQFREAVKALGLNIHVCQILAVVPLKKEMVLLREVTSVVYCSDQEISIFGRLKNQNATKLLADHFDMITIVGDLNKKMAKVVNRVSHNIVVGVNSNVDYLTINLITKSTSPEQILNFVKQTLEKIN
jgi:hypothetical protein